MAERKLFLPLTQSLEDALTPPTVDSMRKRLGGRVPASADRELGSLVTVPGAASRVGVLLSSSDTRCDVFLERGIVKRTNRSSILPFLGVATPELSRVAEQAAVFARLFEGQSVHVERSDGAGLRGILREKCRFGALVETGNGTLLGVGFQRLWPAPQSSDEA